MMINHNPNPLPVCLLKLGSYLSLSEEYSLIDLVSLTSEHNFNLFWIIDNCLILSTLKFKATLWFDVIDQLNASPPQLSNVINQVFTNRIELRALSETSAPTMGIFAQSEVVGDCCGYNWDPWQITLQGRWSPLNCAMVNPSKFRVTCRCFPVDRSPWRSNYLRSLSWCQLGRVWWLWPWCHWARLVAGECIIRRSLTIANSTLW